MTRRQDSSGGGWTWARSLAPGLAWAILACVTAIQPGWAAKPAVPEASPEEAAANPAPVPTRGAPDEAVAAESVERPPIVYVPPSRGRARHTAGAGTRGASTGMPPVSVLAPRDHVGLTSSAQPRLYWQLAETSSTRIELTVVDDEAIEPLVELSLPGPVAAGVHTLDLGALGIELTPDRTYRWFVAVVHDPLRRSRDELAEGAIERIVLPGSTASTSTSPSPTSTPSSPTALVGSGSRATGELRRAALERAREGLWYDAVAILEDALARDPSNAGLRADRASLLEQGALSIAPR